MSVDKLQKEIKTPDDLVSASEMVALGEKNRLQTVEGGLDYESITNGAKFGVRNNPSTFRSFEDEINSQFNIVPVLKADRASERTGVIGYKVGMTHFWDKWGKIQGCTVIQLDRCQVTQVKTKEKDGVDALQVGIGEMLPFRMKRPQIGHLLKHNLPPKRDLAEF